MSGACAQDKLQGSLYPNLFSVLAVLDRLDMALIQDSLGDDFQFDWDAALEPIQSKVGLDHTNFPLSKGREQPGSSNTMVHTGVAFEPSGQSVRILEQESEQGGIVALSSERALTVGLVAVRIVRLICLVLHSARMRNPRRRSSVPKECIWARTSSSLIVTHVKLFNLVDPFSFYTERVCRLLKFEFANTLTQFCKMQ
ncbi:unnamed protein product [Camellia sinensis]